MRAQWVCFRLYKSNHQSINLRGAGIAQWLEHRTRDWKVAGSNPCWNGGRIFFSRVDFLCWLLFRYPFHPRVTTVARKKSRSFCQKCRWQVTAKHAYTLRIEPCFGIGHNLSLMCQMTSEDIKHQLIIINQSEDIKHHFINQSIQRRTQLTCQLPFDLHWAETGARLDQESESVHRAGHRLVPDAGGGARVFS